LFFFLQAEDGIRDFHVTGVQTCALPICFGKATELIRRFNRRRAGSRRRQTSRLLSEAGSRFFAPGLAENIVLFDQEAGIGRDDRSEERRVGKEGRSWELVEYGDGGHKSV